jgi:phospholipid/cholesterol/gamma-HCH transport system ATP-binding protein
MLELRGVSYSVPNESTAGTRRTIIDDVSFRIGEKSIACIMGVSGTGKTTLLRLMAGLLKPNSGEILLNGRDIVPLNERELNQVREDTGFVFQYGALFDSLSVGENVGFGLEQKRVPRKEIEEIVASRLREVGLTDVENKMPSEISGGMKKRVAMARALATSPHLVFYDEPISGLDPVMAGVIDDLVVRLRNQFGTTNIIVSHHVSSVLKIADQILMLHDGRIVADGTPHEIQSSESEVVQQFLSGAPSGPITVQ